MARRPVPRRARPWPPLRGPVANPAYPAAAREALETGRVLDNSVERDVRQRRYFPFQFSRVAVANNRTNPDASIHRWSCRLGATLALIPVLIIEADATSSAWRNVATVANGSSGRIFAAELAAAFVVAERKRAALRAHWLSRGDRRSPHRSWARRSPGSDSPAFSASPASRSSCPPRVAGRASPHVGRLRHLPVPEGGSQS